MVNGVGKWHRHLNELLVAKVVSRKRRDASNVIFWSNAKSIAHSGKFFLKCGNLANCVVADRFCCNPCSVRLAQLTDGNVLRLLQEVKDLIVGMQTVGSELRRELVVPLNKTICL